MKKKCIIGLDFTDKSGEQWQKGLVSRTTNYLADKLVQQQSHRYTTKAKLKSFLNQQRRLNKTMDLVDMLAAKGIECKQFTFKGGKKVYVPVPNDLRPVSLRHYTASPVTYRSSFTAIRVVDFAR